MKSIQRQLIAFGLLIILICAGGGYLNYLYMQDAETAEGRATLLGQATETHLTGTFFNEEGRAIIHGALGLYAYPPEERKALYEKLRVNNADPKTAFSSYASRAQDAVKANLARPLPPGLKENLEKHLAAFQAYHAEIGKVVADLPDTREKFVDALTRMNTLRSRIGDFRKLNTEALAKATADASADRDAAIAKQKMVLLATFSAILLVLAAFLGLTLRQFRAFSSSVGKALDDMRAGRAIVASSGITKTAEFAVVAKALEDMQAKSRELDAMKARETDVLNSRATRADNLEGEVAEFEGTVRTVVAALKGSSAAMHAS
jgi:hypothetical protein